ncbi:MAG TPA: hypothetical protein VLH83_12715 [Chthoniobacterales bacterium]|nr:hypothetical protein [Chthoniobacterales bacterium]
MEDWIRFVKSKKGKVGDELDLSLLEPGDLLKVVTKNSEYVLKIVKAREADLTCRQPGRPNGRVRIMGCTFGRSSSIKPDHLFCGGNLELTYQRNDVPMTHRTTAIKEIHLRHRKQQ